MPYRIDVPESSDAVLDRLVELGALDIDVIAGGIAAIMPDRVDAPTVAAAIGSGDLRVTPALSRDDGSVWVINLRPIRVGRLQIVPAGWPARERSLRMIDAPAFGTGLHPTTALCLEMLDDEIDASRPERVLDVGTGSGVLALAALCLGVPHAVAIDIDADAVSVAAENARLNDLRARIRLVRGGPDAISGSWPLVVANVLAAPLIEMAPALARRVGHDGRLILSGIRSSLSADVARTYERLAMRQVDARTRDGWTAVTLHASW
jgi:ribosomal protein L11 methyltransferase